MKSQKVKVKRANKKVKVLKNECVKHLSVFPHSAVLLPSPIWKLYVHES